MGDSKSWKPGSRPGSATPLAKPPAAASSQRPAAAAVKPNIAPAAAGARPNTVPASASPRPNAAPKPSGGNVANQAGRVIHDARGNAVWDWFKETTRVAIDSTSRLLRKLEVPDLKMEETVEEELRLESERDRGGGYNPYGSSSPPSRTPERAATPTTGRGGSSSGVNKNTGGGYDPYQKSTPSKPPRKP